MRYLENKKRQAHINAFLRFFTLISAFITFSAFGKNNFALFLNEFRWQLLLALAVVLVYTAFRRFYGYMITFFILLTINFFAVSSIATFHSPFQNGTKVFFAGKQDDTLRLFDFITADSPDIAFVSKVDSLPRQSEIPSQYNFLHASDEDNSGFVLSRFNVEQSGRVNIGHAYAEFVKTNGDANEIMYVAVDFSKLSFTQIKDCLNNLSTFVAEQDNPVVIFGDFNMVAWSAPLSTFILKNNLVVKNGLWDNLRNLVIPQHYYILAYEKSDVFGTIMLNSLNSFPIFTRF